MSNRNEYVPNLFKNTEYQPEIFGIVRRWRSILDRWEDKHSSSKLLIAETSRISAEDRKLYYEEGAVPFFFDLIRAKKQCGATAKCFEEIIKDGTSLSADDRWPNFVIGNHDNPRLVDRMGAEYVDAMNMLLLTLPGTPTTYYGEELGMRGGNYAGMTPKDPYAFTSGKLENSRDPERNPMQWDSSPNAGFSSSTKPWLPVTENTDWKTCNVQEQKKSQTSHLSIYKELVQLRQKPAFLNPNIYNLGAIDDVLLFIRKDTKSSFLVVINFGKKDAVFDTKLANFTTAEVVLCTARNPQTNVKLQRLGIKAAEGMVLKLK